MDDIVQASLSPQAIGGALISAFAAGALLLAARAFFQHEVRGLLVGGSPSDPLTLLAAALGLLLVTMATCYVSPRDAP